MSTDINRQLDDLRLEIQARFNITDKKLRGVHSHLGSLRNFVAQSFDNTVETTDAVLSDHEARLFDLEADQTDIFDPVTARFHNIVKRPTAV